MTRCAPRLEEIIGFREIAKNAGHVVDRIGIVKAELALVTLADCLLEKVFQGVSLCLHTRLHDHALSARVICSRCNVRII
jgi:hypothetical protein